MPFLPAFFKWWNLPPQPAFISHSQSASDQESAPSKPNHSNLKTCYPITRCSSFSARLPPSFSKFTRTGPFSITLYEESMFGILIVFDPNLALLPYLLAVFVEILISKDYSNSAQTSTNQWYQKIVIQRMLLMSGNAVYLVLFHLLTPPESIVTNCFHFSLVHCKLIIWNLFSELEVQ